MPSVVEQVKDYVAEEFDQRPIETVAAAGATAFAGGLIAVAAYHGFSKRLEGLHDRWDHFRWEIQDHMHGFELSVIMGAARNHFGRGEQDA